MKKVISLVLMLMIFSVSPVFAGQGRGKVVSIQGVTTVAGEKTIVEILVAVEPGEDAHSKARGILKRMIPEAQEIDSAYYETNGLVWDNFFDSSLDNNYVTVNYNNQDEPGSVDSSLLPAATDTWSNVSSSSFAFSAVEPTNRCPSLVDECQGPQRFDGNNDIGWMDIREPNVLGVTWYGTSRDEFDMALDNTYNWVSYESYANGEYDVQTVWLHELGHALGLGHSNVDGSVMEPYYEGSRRTLHQDDIDGITYLYPAGEVDESPVVTISAPANGAVFANGDAVTFTGTADDLEDGSLSANITWSSDIDGNLGTGGTISNILSGDSVHLITAEVTDSAGNTASDTITVTVGTPPTATIASVESVTYSLAGKRNLFVTVLVLDNLGDPVANASVSIDLYLDGSLLGSGTGTTVSEGTVSFKLSKAQSGCYTTIVTDVSAAGLTWEGSTPENQYCKPAKQGRK